MTKKLCCAWKEAGPDKPAGTTKVKFSNDLSELSITPWDSNFPMKRVFPRSADAAGQEDDGQATMPITRLTSTCPASAL